MDRREVAQRIQITVFSDGLPDRIATGIERAYIDIERDQGVVGTNSQNRFMDRFDIDGGDAVAVFQKQARAGRPDTAATPGYDDNLFFHDKPPRVFTIMMMWA